MRRTELDGTVFYISELLAPFGELTHGVTTRHGGVSPPPFDTLNLGSRVGDDPSNVAENHARLHRALGLDRDNMVDAVQAQADQVAFIRREHRGGRIAGVDALLTTEPGIPLLLRFADCVPILLYDPVHRAIGLVHAGWRGTVAHVVTNAVAAMQTAYDTRPADVVACIGPSIGPCCYQIGSDVAVRVRAAFPDADSLLFGNTGGQHLDLWAANAHLLGAAGVRQIEVAAVCTADHTEDFYSWRKERAETGRFAAIIALKD